MRCLFICISFIAFSYVKAQKGDLLFGNQHLDKYRVDYSQPKEYVIGGINVVGLKYLDKNALISIASLRIGEKIIIPGEDISNSIKKLWKQGILGDVSIYITEIVGNRIYLQINLKERPRLSGFTFTGVPKGQKTTLTEKVTLVRGRIVTDIALKNTRNVIYNYYAEKGFRNTKIFISQKKDTFLANSIMVNIHIKKNKKVKIENIQVEGNAVFNENRIKKKLKKTKEKRFIRIFKPSKFIANTYEEDKKKLIQYYNQQGYKDAKIEYDSVVNIGKKRVKILLKLYEGPKFYYRNIYWTGNYKYDSKTLRSVLGLKKGDVYNPESLSKRLNFNPTGTDITSLYMDDGYLFFSINPVEVLVENDSLDIEMRIHEGEQANINKIIVNGNTKTSDHVIYREIRTLPGQKFSRSQLIRTQRELSTLGYFDPEQIGINPLPNLSDGTVDIGYDLTEKQNDEIELSGGWGGTFGFIGTVGLKFNNFSLKKVPNLKSWRPLPSGDGQQLSFRVQANGRRFQTYSITFTEPWLGGKQPNSFSLNLQYSLQRVFNSSGAVTGSQSVSGITVALGKRLKFPDDFFTMRNSISFLLYHNKNWFTFRDGEFLNLTYNLTFARNSIDNPIYPRSGSSISLSMNFTPPYSLFLRSDSEGTTQKLEDKFVEYHKYIFDNSWFLQLANKLVLNVRLHYGFISSYSNTLVGNFNRFVLGGSGLTRNTQFLGTDIVALRGYDDNSVVPFGLENIGGVSFAKYVVELRYPVSLNPSATIYLLGFLEGGKSWRSISEFDPFGVYRSAGGGVRIFMPAFGMLGFDYAVGFDNIPGRSGVNGPHFHFTIGQLLR